MMRKVLLLLMVFVVAGISCQQDGEEATKPVLVNEGTFKMPEKPVLVMETNQGTIKLRLYPKVAPWACQNMIRLAEKGYYDGVIFHRVIKGFMLQGGDPTGTGRGGQSIWKRNFGDEVSDKVRFNKRGLLAMANSGPGTNGSQFFNDSQSLQVLDRD